MARLIAFNREQDGIKVSEIAVVPGRYGEKIDVDKISEFLQKKYPDHSIILLPEILDPEVLPPGMSRSQVSNIFIGFISRIEIMPESQKDVVLKTLSIVMLLTNCYAYMQGMEDTVRSQQ